MRERWNKTLRRQAEMDREEEAEQAEQAEVLRAEQAATHSAAKQPAVSFEQPRAAAQLPSCLEEDSHKTLSGVAPAAARRPEK